MIKRKFVFAHMNVATTYAKLSYCKRLQVGAVIVKGDTPIAIGYNGTKPGEPNCCEGADGKTHAGVRHAEINALNKLWTSKESADGSAVFITHAPCKDCAQDLANAGVKEFYYRWDYRDTAGLEWLLHQGLEVHKVLPDLEIIKRLKLAYNNDVDPYREIVYETITDITEANKEAARVARELAEDREPVAPEVQREVFIPFFQTVDFNTIFSQDNESFREGAVEGGVHFLHAGGR